MSRVQTEEARFDAMSRMRVSIELQLDQSDSSIRATARSERQLDQSDSA
jgi:hypothetical protein